MKPGYCTYCTLSGRPPSVHSSSSTTHETNPTQVSVAAPPDPIPKCTTPSSSPRYRHPSSIPTPLRGVPTSSMPVSFRVAGVDVCLGGAPAAHHIADLAISRRSSTLATYPSQTFSATATPPGHHINTHTKTLSAGRKAFSLAAQALTGEALELPWLRLWRLGRGSRWQEGDVVIISARVLPFVWTNNVNRVVSVTRTRRRHSVAWGTTSRHVLRGEEMLQVEHLKTGDVVFRLRSFSRPHAFLAWLTYPYILYLQTKFARDVSKQLVKISNET